MYRLCNLHKKVVVVDFDDSFTYNICADLQLFFSIEPTVLHYQELIKIFNTPKWCTESSVLVFGPGPGHPYDYKDIYPVVEKVFKVNGFIMGICLGHQIILNFCGGKIVNSAVPMHGEVVDYVVPRTKYFTQEFVGNKVQVQRYNSLAVDAHSFRKRVNSNNKNFDVDIDVMTFDNRKTYEIFSAFADNFISYQFHPESIGTSCRKEFFRPILSKLSYNHHDGRPNKSIWNL